MNNPKLNDYIDAIYSQELEIKDTTDAPKWPNYLDLHLEFDEDGTLFTRLYDKRDDFDFPIVHFPYLISSYCCKSWRVPHVGQEMLTLPGTHDFTPFGEFMISPIHYKLNSKISE